MGKKLFDYVIGNEGVIYGLNAGKARDIKATEKVSSEKGWLFQL